jgi:hypothetical protein
MQLKPGLGGLGDGSRLSLRLTRNQTCAAFAAFVGSAILDIRADQEIDGLAEIMIFIKDKISRK